MNSDNHFKHKCEVLYDPFKGSSITYKMRVWCAANVNDGEYVWVTWPYIATVVSFKNEVDLIVFKIRFGV